MSNWRNILLWTSPEGYDEENSEGLDETLKSLSKVNSGDLVFLNNVINFLQKLPQEYKDKVYAKIVIFNSLYPEMLLKNPKNIKQGDIILSHVGIDNVGNYWERSDLPLLYKLANNFNLYIKYSHTLHYVTLEDKND